MDRAVCETGARGLQRDSNGTKSFGWPSLKSLVSVSPNYHSLVCVFVALRPHRPTAAFFVCSSCGPALSPFFPVVSWTALHHHQHVSLGYAPPTLATLCCTGGLRVGVKAFIRRLVWGTCQPQHALTVCSRYFRKISFSRS